MTAPGSAARRVVVALAGRQNAGKTSLLMQLTGAVQKPVNFPGSSVERVESSVLVGDTLLHAVDLPGIGSLRPISRDEEVAVGFLLEGDGERPHVICAVLDASKLSVELRLLEQLCRLGLPVVVALNKVDVAASQGTAVDLDTLSARLRLPVLPTNALGGEGVDALREALIDASGGPAAPELPCSAEALAAEVQHGPDRPLQSRTDRIDALVLHRFLGLPLLGLVVFGIFQVIFSGAEPAMNVIEAGQDALGAWIGSVLAPGALQSLLVDGVVNGLGSVLIFLPQIALLMFLVALLEATGYMARAAFLLDRVLGRFGLSGRSFVPLVSSFACAVPGILSTRIIENERDRIATIVVAPLMSCSARLPVYVLLVGAFFPPAWAGAVLLAIYALGILTAVAVAWGLRRTVLRGGQSVFMMELPPYQRPSWRVIRGQVGSACRAFLVLAGTIIFATSVVIWLLSYYPRPAGIHERFEERRAQVAAEVHDPGERATRVRELEGLEKTAYLEQSLLARFGKTVQPLFAPAGFDWKVTVGILAAFPARELIVPTLGIMYAAGEVDPSSYALSDLGGGEAHPDGLRQRLRNAAGPDGRRTFNPLVALSIMVFFALCSQCVSTLGTIRRETRSWRWPLFTFTYMTVLAWLAATITYQVGAALGHGLG